MREFSYPITKEQYNYLLPVYGIATFGRTRIGERYVKRQGITTYYFIGTDQDYKEMLQKCFYLR